MVIFHTYVSLPEGIYPLAIKALQNAWPGLITRRVTGMKPPARHL